jgi:hypothetical protein
VTDRHLGDRHLAQYSVARLRDPLDGRAWQELRDGVDRLNLLAERSPGFVWRRAGPEAHLVGEGGTFDNLSVWESYDDLHRFVYRSDHGTYTRRRRRWFVRVAGPTSVLWWVTAGEQPTLAEAQARLDHLRRHGSSPQAFSLLRQYDADGRFKPPPSSSGRTRGPRGRR